MKKSFFGFSAMILMCLSMYISVFAGNWQKDPRGWRYQNDDASYSKNTWQWIVDSEGIKESCYYFDANGYLLINSKTHDGYDVDKDGKWIVNSYPQTRYTLVSYANYLPIYEAARREYEPEYVGKLISSDVAASYYGRYCYGDGKAEVRKAVYDKYSLIDQNPTPEFVKTQVVNVEVPIWKLGKNEEKIPSKTSVTVLAEIKDEVYEVFNEIYNGPEKFPIKDIGGYQWRSNGLRSYHSSGLAIDINANENPQMTPDETKAIVGTAWQPYTNPYSITPDGDVAKAFGKHGFSWGASFGRADYMHFEFHRY